MGPPTRNCVWVAGEDETRPVGVHRAGDHLQSLAPLGDFLVERHEWRMRPMIRSPPLALLSAAKWYK